MHILFAPCGVSQLENLRERFPTISSFPYFDSLKSLNGCDLFFGGLTLYGVRVPFKKGNVPYFVFDIFEHNEDFFQLGLQRGRLVVGSIANDGEYHIVQYPDGRIEEVERDSGEKTRQWPDLKTFLSREILRLSKSNGGGLDP
ncbi:hypothetical protein [Defluviimonas sp. SAOS-178_SWC]|uniref:hypothetical protein n=1 Tax=Defluviimonas sp. SAOS-178_SWC TaxID=3121287 RepID=UPI0032215190